MSARKRVVYLKNRCNMVSRRLAIQFYTMTVSIGLAYRQKVHVVCLICRVTVIFGCLLVGINCCVEDFSYTVCLVGDK